MPSDANDARSLPLHLNCPHCHNPIEIVAHEAEDNVVCPSCGSSFRLDPDHTQTWSADKLPTLGRFALIEAVGRGAFGTVYRARDGQLRRTVAVKVPRSGQLVTPEDEDRFVREARNVAQLQHPGIVPVYEVGHSETFPFIVSEFVDGITLTDALSARKFGFREAAELIRQIADALQHAHDHGVVHRDLKPSNVMLTPEGSPRVMDFGLAKRDAGEITVTVEGQVLGTPAFMSPEQACGQSHTVDGRSDIYSLGVILYELLTGEMPFRGNQRMLIYQVLHDEPRSLRSLNDRIPRDLETITQKAMAKEPARRYQTAAAMADDLGRFLAGQPIEARPVGRAERAWRWCRRNPMVAGLSAAVALALVIGTSASTYFAVQADARAREAIAERQRAEANLAEATRERRRAEENLEEVNRQRERADAGFREAQAAVDKYYTTVSESKLLDVPGLQPVRKELLESALEYYQKFIGEHGDDPKVQAEMAAAYRRVGNITSKIGSQEEALVALEKAAEVYQQIVERDPADRHYHYRLSATYIDLGWLQASTGRTQEAIATYHRAIEIDDKLVREDPSNADYRSGLAKAYVWLGSVHDTSNHNDDAEVSYKRASEIEEQLVGDHPSKHEYQDDLARAYTGLGLLQGKTGRNASAEAIYRRVVEIREKLVRDKPANTRYQSALALAYNNLGVVRFGRGRPAEAEDLYKRSLEIFQRLARENPRVVEYEEEVASQHNNLGLVQRATRRTADAEASVRRCLAGFEKLAQEHPTVRLYQTRLAFTRLNLATILFMSNRWPESIPLLAEAAKETECELHALFRLAFAQAAIDDDKGYRATCAKLLALHDPDTDPLTVYSVVLACIVNEHAVDDMDQVVEIAKGLVGKIPFNPLFLTVLGASQYRAGHISDALATLKAAAPAHAIALVAAPGMADGVRLSQMTCQVFLMKCYRELKDPKAAQQHAERVRAHVEQLETASQPYILALEPWAVPFGILLAKRELARLNSDQSAAK